MQNKKSLTWIWVLLLLAGLSAFAWFVVIPWWNKDKESPPTGGGTKPTTGGGSGGGSGSGGGGSSGGNGGSSTGTGNLLPIYNLHYKTKVKNLAKNSAQAKLAQFITKEGLKSFGIADNVGAIDGKIGPKTKAGINSLIATLPLQMQIFTADDITLEGLAKLVQAKINGSESVETGISRITYNMLK